MTLDLFADAALADGRLARPFDHACPVNDSYWLVEQTERHRSEAARAFADWILDQ
jgi:DNA-binding transcriptional LysR family regulator